MKMGEYTKSGLIKELQDILIPYKKYVLWDDVDDQIIIKPCD